MVAQPVKIKRLLIANRGEIALRILRTAHEMGIHAVVVYERPDREAYYIKSADEAVLIGDGPRKDYLDIDKILWAARKTNVDAIHPGYGFLSESADFAEACEKAGIIFIGPPPSVIRNLGNKLIAKGIAKMANIPTIPATGALTPGQAGIQETEDFCKEHGLPVMVKAASGGGGRGIRKVLHEKDIEKIIPIVRSEALSSFKNEDIYVEKYIHAPRHIEIQILADQHGNVVHLGSRDCSIQRRNQKLLEIAPADLPSDVLDRMYDCSIQLARAVGYVNAGTVEFLVDSQTNEFWFLEVNTRLQVEHTVTEELTGVDIVRRQIRIAEGHVLDIPKERVRMLGKAIQVRINAEDPKNNFMPEGGKRLEVYQSGGGPGIRRDGAVYQGYRIPMEYDSLLVKLTIRAYDWEQAVERLKRALRDFVIVGPKTTIPLYLAICDEPDFKAGRFDTSYIETHPEIFNYPEPEREIAKIARLIAEIHAKKFNPHAY